LKFKFRLIVWVVVAFLIPLLIWIIWPYDAKQGLPWILFVIGLATVYEVIIHFKK